MFGERERACSDLFVGLLDFLRLKRWSTIQHGVQDDAYRPVVNLIAVASTSLEDFRCQIIGRTTNGTLLLTLVENLRSQSEISHLELHFVREEQVAEF